MGVGTHTGGRKAAACGQERGSGRARRGYRRAAAEHGRERNEAHRRKARAADRPAESHGASRKKARTQPPLRWNSPPAAHAPEGGESGWLWDGRAAAKGERMAAIA